MILLLITDRILGPSVYYSFKGSNVYKQYLSPRYKTGLHPSLLTSLAMFLLSLLCLTSPPGSQSTYFLVETYNSLEEGGGRDYQWKLEDTPVGQTTVEERENFKSSSSKSVSQSDHHISYSTPLAKEPNDSKRNRKSTDPTERKESSKAMKTVTEIVGYTIS